VAQPSSAELSAAMARLGLTADGPLFSSLNALLRPVTFAGRPAMLKLSHEPEELTGAEALAIWSGNGAVRVLARDGHAVVLERAGETLRSRITDDAQATRILCNVAAGGAGWPSIRRGSPARASSTT
jgi:streptomycin 6-kinase